MAAAAAAASESTVRHLHLRQNRHPILHAPLPSNKGRPERVAATCFIGLFTERLLKGREKRAFRSKSCVYDTSPERVLLGLPPTATVTRRTYGIRAVLIFGYASYGPKSTIEVHLNLLIFNNDCKGNNVKSRLNPSNGQPCYHKIKVTFIM